MVSVTELLVALQLLPPLSSRHPMLTLFWGEQGPVYIMKPVQPARGGDRHPHTDNNPPPFLHLSQMQQPPAGFTTTDLFPFAFHYSTPVG